MSMTTGSAPARTYQIRTHGCQMNVHDSERLAGLLETAGYARAVGEDAADVVVFNTCAVRENADNKLYGSLGNLRPTKMAKPGMQIAVGGCLAQKDRNTIVERAPWVDVVFGTHNIGSLPVLLERARVHREAQVEIEEALTTFPSNLPTHRDSAYSGWVSISVGCNNTCTFCIVPALRGKETDRRPGEVLAEIKALVAEGVQEITLLGLHMPLQSGSDTVLRAMRRSYRSERYLKIIDNVRAAMPEAAISTDIIVGFPGETEADFQATLDVAAASRFAAAFTFQYSIRPGTPAATMPDQVPKAVVQERYERLVGLVNEISWQENLTKLGRSVEVMFANGEGRKDAATARMSGRARDNRLVHVTVSDDEVLRPRPGDLADALITYAAPHHLTADAGLTNLRRTRGGDAWAARQGQPDTRPAVNLGLPTLGLPPALPTAPTCSTP
jgi:tRNA-2-methylthio-N6-dimethylallyladenosine synthase